MDTHFSLSWDAYQKNICRGLGAFQQHGEFVDMTLAADGHHVKVHQIVLSLVSPYIKDLISSAQCPHPVIFLNNISYATLSSILQYIYTGEVYVPQENLSDLLAAGRALHIKGLQEMEDTSILQDNTSIIQDDTRISQDDNSMSHNSMLDDDDSLQAVDKPNIEKKTLLEQLQECKESKRSGAKLKRQAKSKPSVCKIFIDENSSSEIIEDSTEMNTSLDKNIEKLKYIRSSNAMKDNNKALCRNTNIVQYSLSNQGGLQMIFNRYIYALKYVQKKLIKFWRCADSGSKKCPANIYTNDRNQVIKRTFNHNHPFHDKNILKKIRLGLIFTAFNEAQSRARCKTIETKPRPPSTEYTDSE